MNETPRTDAAAIEACGHCDDDDDGQAVVPIRSARALERELTAGRAARERAEAERDALAEALRFYADHSTYDTHRLGGPEDPPDCYCPIGEDQGQVARAALAALEREAGLTWNEFAASAVPELDSSAEPTGGPDPAAAHEENRVKQALRTAVHELPKRQRIAAEDALYRGAEDGGRHSIDLKRAVQALRQRFHHETQTQ